MSKRAAADGWSLAELEAAARPKKSRANVDPSAAAKILRHARDTAAKDAALDTLTKAACPEAADLIAAALRTGEATTRWKALKALNKIGETAVREHAKLILSQVTTLQDCPANKRNDDESARNAAVYALGAALGALCDAEATTRKEAIALRAEFEPTLRALAEDAVESVRNAAKDELEDREW